MTAVQRVVSEEGADRKMPPGVLLEGPVVDAKFRDSYIAFGIMIGGSIAALVWAFTQGIGWVEISVFVGTFVLSTIGIGFMHRYFVHRSFRCGPVMRTLLAAIATMAVQGSVLKWVSNHRRHHLHSDKPGDVHSPYYDGAGNRHVSFRQGDDACARRLGVGPGDHRCRILRQGYSGRPDRHVLHPDTLVLVRDLGGDHSGRHRLRAWRRARDDRLRIVLRPVPQLRHDHGHLAGQLGLP